MFRTMITETPFQQKWVLQGRLCSRWAEDLKRQWEQTRNTRKGRDCAIDLEDVVFVDSAGERVLLEMVGEGAVLLASRAYMKDVVESLTGRPPQINNVEKRDGNFSSRFTRSYAAQGSRKREAKSRR